MTTPQYPGGVAARPKSVDMAFMLFLAAAVAGIISSLLNFVTADAVYDAQIEDAAEKLGIPADQLANTPEMGGVAAAGVGAGVFLGLILFAAWIACVFLMRDGKNWARIVLAVLGGFGILFGLIGLFGIGLLFSAGIVGIIQALLSLIQLGLTIAAIIFMFKSDANAYFAAAR